MRLYSYLFCISIFTSSQAISQTTILPYASAWKYLDNGSNQGTEWKTSLFSDAAWKSGNADFGYGDNDETTVVSFGPTADNKYITTFFRKTISVPDTTIFSAYQLNIKRDDGAVVYINGLEVYRINMPTGTISYSTLALAAPNDDGNTEQITPLPVSKMKKRALI
jgi:hypothetical protein